MARSHSIVCFVRSRISWAEKTHEGQLQKLKNLWKNQIYISFSGVLEIALFDKQMRNMR